VMVSVARVTEMSIRRVLAAMWPGAAASAGVVATVGAVRLWSGLSAVPELAVAAVAGAAGILIALAVLAPPTFTELRHGALGVGRRLRPRATVT
jgi:hypothetical protein